MSDARTGDGDARYGGARRKDTRPISLALQGGGAHGAFTWGVLDRLLEEDDLEPAAISGTSAGAVNGVLLAAGLADGGRSAARERLDAFWERMASLAALSPLQPSVLDHALGAGRMDFSPGYWTLELLSRLFSPYAYNALDINPLREALPHLVDFAALAEGDGPALFVSATHVKTGRVKVFGRRELSLEALLASACLPFLHRAVEVDGEAYWDGGYLGNPAIRPLVEGSQCRDVVLVQVAPLTVEEVPTSAQDIFDRVSTIACNAGLLRELQALEANAGDGAGEPLRLHRIEAEAAMRALRAGSKLNADRRFLTRLKELGRERAEAWLVEARPHLGRRSTHAPLDMYL